MPENTPDRAQLTGKIGLNEGRTTWKSVERETKLVFVVDAAYSQVSERPIRHRQLRPRRLHDGGVAHVAGRFGERRPRQRDCKGHVEAGARGKRLQHGLVRRKRDDIGRADA